MARSRQSCQSRCVNKRKERKKKKRSHCNELLPRVAPGPVVGFVQSSPHSHQLVATVIEDGPVEENKKMNQHFFCIDLLV